ncbi:hypothetical protein M6B38_322805 [Iris pallida]|uniref:Uncharacterized protein n=1 Tax=Iris pallida TaxID=29817 RepID=A0AAX6HA95_IRIPA|nr:hypothetical protein M6B38_322805 [Iris pallida]
MRRHWWLVDHRGHRLSLDKQRRRLQGSISPAKSFIFYGGTSRSSSLVVLHRDFVTSVEITLMIGSSLVIDWIRNKDGVLNTAGSWIVSDRFIVSSFLSV